MSYFPVLHSCFLEPLEEIPLVVPFPEAHLDSSGPGALGLFNETPSTIDMSLPTPSIPVLTVFTDGLPSPAQVHYDTPPPQSEAIQPPPAPQIKDMDSFSDGTTQGSFDFTMCSDHGDGQVAPSIAFSPSHPTLSIEIWRDDVVRNTTVRWQEGRAPRGDEDGHIFEEPATKRRRLSSFPPAAEEERPITGPIMRRSRSLPPNSLYLIRDGDDPSVTPPPVVLSSPYTAPPTLA